MHDELTNQLHGVTSRKPRQRSPGPHRSDLVEPSLRADECP